MPGYGDPQPAQATEEDVVAVLRWILGLVLLVLLAANLPTTSTFWRQPYGWNRAN
jgi:hypothetical protein